MDLREMILKEHSKKQADKIIRWIGEDQKKFDALVKLFLGDESSTAAGGTKRWGTGIALVDNIKTDMNKFYKF